MLQLSSQLYDARPCPLQTSLQYRARPAQLAERTGVPAATAADVGGAPRLSRAGALRADTAATRGTTSSSSRGDRALRRRAFVGAAIARAQRPSDRRRPRCSSRAARRCARPAADDPAQARADRADRARSRTSICRRARTGCCSAAFRRASFYRQSGRRWRSLRARARVAVALADFSGSPRLAAARPRCRFAGASRSHASGRSSYRRRRSATACGAGRSRHRRESADRDAARSRCCGRPNPRWPSRLAIAARADRPLAPDVATARAGRGRRGGARAELDRSSGRRSGRPTGCSPTSARIDPAAVAANRCVTLPSVRTDAR